MRKSSPTAGARPGTLDVADARQITIKRNRIVLVLLLAFVSFAFALGFYHGTREMRGSAPKQQGLTSPASDDSSP